MVHLPNSVVPQRNRYGADLEIWGTEAGWSDGIESSRRKERLRTTDVAWWYLRKGVLVTLKALNICLQRRSVISGDFWWWHPPVGPEDFGQTESPIHVVARSGGWQMAVRWAGTVCSKASHWFSWCHQCHVFTKVLPGIFAGSSQCNQGRRSQDAWPIGPSFPVVKLSFFDFLNFIRFPHEIVHGFTVTISICIKFIDFLSVHTACNLMCMKGLVSQEINISEAVQVGWVTAWSLTKLWASCLLNSQQPFNWIYTETQEVQDALLSTKWAICHSEMLDYVLLQPVVKPVNHHESSLVDRGTRDHNLSAILANVSQNVAWISYSSSTDFSVSQKDAAPTWFVCSGLVWVSYRLKWDGADVATVLPLWLQSAQIPARPHDLHTFPRAKMYIIMLLYV